MARKNSEKVPFRTNRGPKVLWPSIKYAADGSSRLFETEEEFTLDGEGYFENVAEAQAAAEAPAPKTKAKGKPAHAKVADAFDRDAAIATLTEAGYTELESATDDELKAAVEGLKG